MPGVGTVLPGFRTTAEWGTLQAAQVLVAPDRSRFTLPVQGALQGASLTGDGWTLTIANGWSVRPGARAGDFQIARDTTVPVASEPRHHFQIANDYVRVYDVVVPRGDTTLYHLHAVDYTYVAFGPATLVAQILGSDATPLVLRDGEVRFTKGPITHRVSNPGATPFHNLTIELLAHDSATSLAPSPPDAPTDSVMLDNERVRVVRRTIARGKTVEFGSRVLGVYLSGGRVQSVLDRKRGEQRDVQPATFAWFGEPGTHGVRNVGKQPLVLLTFSVK
jgi:oxalate decarboxylase/phosphoglucose isomerase-like protein (cupin superfamily)